MPQNKIKGAVENSTVLTMIRRGQIVMVLITLSLFPSYCQKVGVLCVAEEDVTHMSKK